MATTIEMPRMGFDMQEGTVVRWLKGEGDSVDRGEVIAEIETDKAVVEMEANAGGVLKKIVVREGTTVPVGALIGVITGPDEEMPPLESLQASAASAPMSGADGAGNGEASVPAMFPNAPPDGERLPLSRMRQVIASRTSRSMREAPHFYVTSEIDMGKATDFRRDFNDTLPEGVRVSVSDLIIKACARAIEKYPNFNAYFQDNHLVTSPHINIGIAVALDQGLIIPSIPDCQDRDLVNIAQASKDLIERAHGGTLKAGEYTGGTFAISNLGMYDVDSFTAIIYPPNAAVLAIGSVKEKPVVKSGQITVARMMKVTLSIDHRVVDGAGGAQFLQEVKRLLERPVSLLS